MRSMSGVLSKSNFQFGQNNFDVIVFKNNDGENESYFVAKRVAEALGYADPKDAVQSFCPDRIEYRALISKGGCQPPLSHHPQTSMISELDVYSLIFGSSLPKAKDFKYFVCGVIKSIRIHGCYPPPGQIPELPETQHQHHTKEMDRIEQMSEAEKKIENRYQKTQWDATKKPQNQ